jgi:hypothetical protein
MQVATTGLDIAQRVFQVHVCAAVASEPEIASEERSTGRSHLSSARGQLRNIRRLCTVVAGAPGHSPRTWTH